MNALNALNALHVNALNALNAPHVDPLICIYSRMGGGVVAFSVLQYY